MHIYTHLCVIITSEPFIWVHIEIYTHLSLWNSPEIIKNLKLQKEGAEGFEETLTSTEFDKFLEERAAAAENLPNIAAANTNSSATSNAGADNQKKSSTKKPGDDDLLLLWGCNFDNRAHKT